jgi:hypothetical protein
LGSLKENDHSAEPGIDGRLKLKRILEQQGWRVRTGLIWLNMGPGGHGNEQPGSRKGGEILDQLSVPLASQEGPRSMDLDNKLRLRN